MRAISRMSAVPTPRPRTAGSTKRSSSQSDGAARNVEYVSKKRPYPRTEPSTSATSTSKRGRGPKACSTRRAAASSSGGGSRSNSARPRTRLTTAGPSPRRAERIVKPIASDCLAAKLVEQEVEAVVAPEALAVDREDRDAEDPLLQAQLQRLPHLVVIAPGCERVEKCLARETSALGAVCQSLPVADVAAIVPTRPVTCSAVVLALAHHGVVS